VSIRIDGRDIPRGGGVVNIALVKEQCEVEYTIPGIYPFESHNLRIEVLLFQVDFDILISYEPDQRVLKESRRPGRDGRVVLPAPLFLQVSDCPSDESPFVAVVLLIKDVTNNQLTYLPDLEVAIWPLKHANQLLLRDDRELSSELDEYRRLDYRLT
jgi:hypothetical protein